MFSLFFENISDSYICEITFFDSLKFLIVDYVITLNMIYATTEYLIHISTSLYESVDSIRTISYFNFYCILNEKA